MRLNKSTLAAISLVEIMITIAIISVAGAGVFSILRAGTILFGKNTAINLSHTESRFGLINLQQDLTSAVSTPELTDTGGNILSSGTATGPAAGVSFQAYAGGPFCLYAPSSTTSIASTATSIQVITGSNFRPLPGETIHIQVLPIATSLVEVKLSGSTAYTATSTSSGVTYTPTLANAIGTTINLDDPIATTALNVACFFTTPIIYVVQNGRLIKQSLDPAGTGKMISTILAYNVTSATPFSMPTVNSSPQNTFLQVQNMTATDPSSNQRGYKGVLTPLTVQIPHFSQMTVQY